MKKIFALALVIFISLFGIVSYRQRHRLPIKAWVAANEEQVTIAAATTTAPKPTIPKAVSLSVPHIWEIPDGVWVKPWNNACEEASIIMIEEYYLSTAKRKLPPKEIKQKLWPLFTWEDKIFGSNADTDAARTARIINEYSSFSATVIKNPKLEDIKMEISLGHPVMSFHYAKGMNPDHRFAINGSYYHVMVITGYDDIKQEFLINDSEFKNGLDYRYPYATIMDTLHDFDHKRRKADGPPTVLFTQPKQLVKPRGKGTIYLVENNEKRYISSPQVFKNHRWSWSAVKTVDAEWLMNLPSGSTITK
ncbi:MAG: hypothetical protein A3I29_04990 [Candidatus Magasanikbacteria bacterium RIFCSPLOWO2_02_FULL_44_11]|uniref:Peptidase C39-like domain-containing protein n=2 Tax=Candidatus Magasanikiibacteriota TaxID=1752731 RepID=A0A1F6NAA3_9BACT|nr:MAG: hypothetical protein A3D53_02275 [Candidatus Magasanikbacteria bacterium RIFCSPHIGHO2_02_FULL_45_10]OGH80809.1 MAG: hypothetical protein A3I29_04990 [Candidatus Magasanikbacteria bacterium RIFCSPLOWO2_02_FULL_44_11]